MRKITFTFLLCISVSLSLFAQSLKTHNLIIVTLDGFRWQELFQGADSAILFSSRYVADKSAVGDFWDNDKTTRREKLLPFFWKVVGEEGQLYGNRQYQNFVNCANPHWFSYPGYSELLTGMAERKVRSNAKIENPNPTVLEYIHQQPGFGGRVAAFSTWDVIPFVLRESKCGFPVSDGTEFAIGDSLTERELLLQDLQRSMHHNGSARHDAFTFYYAHEYLKRKSPRVLLISFDETDQHAHAGRYDQYLAAAHQTDRLLGQLWRWLQTDVRYKDKTTLLITTDHGRGRGAKQSWKDHGRLAFGSGQVWFAVIGPDTPPLGEMRTARQYFQKQFARTSAAFLGLDYENTEPVGDVIREMLPVKTLAVGKGPRSSGR
jgi:hypothetical protein